MTMQMTYLIEIVDGIAVTRFFKKPDVTEAIGAMDEVFARGKFQLRLWVLEDGIDLRHEELAKIARHGRQLWSAPSRAAIVAADDLSYGLMRVHDVYREQALHVTRVFRTEQEAVAWLGEVRNLQTPKGGQKDVLPDG